MHKFEVGERIEVTVEDDLFYRSQGEVVEVYKSDSGWQTLGAVIDNTDDIGSPVLWFSFNELRKVDA